MGPAVDPTYGPEYISEISVPISVKPLAETLNYVLCAAHIDFDVAQFAFFLA